MVKYSTTGYWHTENGIYYLGETLKRCFRNRYKSLVESMFYWEDDSGSCDMMFKMSRHRAPEKFLIGNSDVAIFNHEGNTQMLPIAQTNMLNVYGEMTEWHVVPVAWADNGFYRELMDRTFTDEDSVLVMNSLHGTNDSVFIDMMVNLLVDGILTLNQRVLMTRAPFVFTVEGSPDADVSTYMNAIFNFKPWITTNAKGALTQATISDVNIALDPSMLDVISYWESSLLSYVGISATDIHKRAQQSVPETNMAQDKIVGRRKEKLRCRQKAAEAYNDLFGTNIVVHSVFDEMEQQNGRMDRGPAAMGENSGPGPES